MPRIVTKCNPPVLQTCKSTTTPCTCPVIIRVKSRSICANSTRYSSVSNRNTIFNSKRSTSVNSKNSSFASSRIRSSYQSPVQEAKLLLQVSTPAFKCTERSLSASLEGRSRRIWKMTRTACQWVSTRCHRCQVVTRQRLTQQNLGHDQDKKKRRWEELRIWSRKR